MKRVALGLAILSLLLIFVSFGAAHHAHDRDAVGVWFGTLTILTFVCGVFAALSAAAKQFDL